MNTQQGWTTIEQSKKLIEAGLDPNTADMYYQSTLPKSGKFLHNPTIGNPCEALKWYNLGYTKSGKIGVTFEEFCIPCWSLGALLKLMPKENENPFKDSNAFIGYGDKKYRCVYLNGDWESSHQTIGDTTIEAAYNMVVWLLENGYIKEGGNR